MLVFRSNGVKTMLLSKSDYMIAYNCVKALWLKKNRKDLNPEVSTSQQAAFDAGNEVQEVARKYFNGGIMIDVEPWEVDKGTKLTKDMSKKHDVIFEGFAKLPWGAFCRIDVMRKNNKDWDLIEIKASTNLKEEYIIDLAFQYYVFKKAGYSIKDCYVLHLNKNYRRDNKLNVKKLFNLEKVTNEVIDRYNEVEKLAPHFFDIQKFSKEPAKTLCKACKECQFFHYCGKDIPEYSIFDILRNPKADEVYKKRGTAEISPDILKYCTKHTIIDVECALANEEHIDKKLINNFLNSLEYPLYYLDYETLNPAIPLFQNSEPYKQIPFQFSLHIQKEKGSHPQHIGFLHKEKSDPRRRLAETLIKNCGKKGSIIVYNENFEKTRNKELAELLPDLAKDLLAINNRIIDLLVPFKQRALYNPKQQSSASIKKVLPAFTELSYKEMEVKNGGEAMDRYLAFMKGKLSAEEEKILFEGLEEYCCQDTLAMVKLVNILYKKAK